MILPKAVALSLQFITLVGAPDRVPRLDVEPVCRGIAEQGGVTFHDPSMPQEKKNCIDSEQAVRDQLVKQWSGFSGDDRTHCINETTMGGELSYTELLTCLEMARDVRAMRAEASRSVAAAPPSPMPASQPTPPEPAPSRPGAGLAPPSPPIPNSQPTPSSARATPTNDVASFELELLRKDLDRAKADAQSATTSQVSAERKLADAEAALRRMKDEADRAKDEARRAKEEAQAAKEFRGLRQAQAGRRGSRAHCGGEAMPKRGQKPSGIRRGIAQVVQGRIASPSRTSKSAASAGRHASNRVGLRSGPQQSIPVVLLSVGNVGAIRLA